MKKILLLILIGLLAACESAPLPQEAGEAPVLVLTYVEGLEPSIERFFNRPVSVVRSLDGLVLSEYERVLVLYEDELRRVVPPSTLNGPRVDYLNLVTFIHSEGVEVTMVYMDGFEDFEEMFRVVDQRIFQINEPQIVYELYPLQGIHAQVDSTTLDQVLLLQQLPLNAVAAPSGRNLRWFYTSQEVYLFLENEFPAYLAPYADQLRGLNEAVVVINTPRGQRLVIGRAYGANVAAAYALFVEAVASGIEEPTSLTPPEIPLQTGRVAPPQACYLKDLRGPVYPKNVPQPTTVSNDIPDKRLSSVGRIVGLNIMIGFDEYPEIVTKAQYRTIIQRALDSSDAFYEEMSNGQLTFEWRFHPDIVTIPFFLEPGMGPGTREFEQRVFESLEQVTAIVEEITDLTDVNLIQFFWPIGTPNEVYGGIEILLDERMDTQQGNIYNFNVRKLEMRHFNDPDSLTIYHGIGHNLGFTDIYLFTFMPEFQDKPRYYKYGNWDMMTVAQNELNGWHRWMATWVRDEQVHCLPLTSQTEYEVILEPLNDDEATTRLIVIALSETQAISIELRGPGTYCPSERWRSSSMELLQGGCTQNILVTHINAMIGNGSGPKQILRPARSIQADYSDSLVLQGEFVTYQNITITHSERNSSSSLITIKFD